MNADIVFGLFALYVALMSLGLVLSGHQDAMLERMRSLWGRPLGHMLYFGARVALPMLLCVLCLGWGVRHYDGARVADSTRLQLQLNVDDYRTLLLTWQEDQGPDTADIVYGA